MSRIEQDREQDPDYKETAEYLREFFDVSMAHKLTFALYYNYRGTGNRSLLEIIKDLSYEEIRSIRNIGEIPARKLYYYIHHDDPGRLLLLFGEEIEKHEAAIERLKAEIRKIHDEEERIHGTI